MLLVGLGRFVQDLLLWSTAEFGYLRLGDGFVQCSSIMPQKRNPVALEHARAIGSKALGQAQAIVTAVHNTPFGDIVDTEDDLQPLVFSMFRDATRAVKLVAAAMATAEFDAGAPRGARRRRLDDADRAGRHAGARSRLAVPDRACDCRPPDCRARSATPTARLRTSLPTRPGSRWARRSSTRKRRSPKILSPRHFVSVRRTLGGPAPEETARAAGVSRSCSTPTKRGGSRRPTRSREAERRLAERSAAL